MLSLLCFDVVTSGVGAAAAALRFKPAMNGNRREGRESQTINGLVGAAMVVYIFSNNEKPRPESESLFPHAFPFPPPPIDSRTPRSGTAPRRWYYWPSRS